MQVECLSVETLTQRGFCHPVTTCVPWDPTQAGTVTLSCPQAILKSHVQLFLYSVQWPDGLLIMPCSFTALLLVGRGIEITRAPVSYLHLP